MWKRLAGAPLFVWAVGASVGELMSMRMVRPLVFAGVGEAFFSPFRATGEFMFAGGRCLRFRGRRPLRFGLRRPVNVGDVLGRDGVGLEGRSIRNWHYAVVGGHVRNHMRPTRLCAAIPRRARLSDRPATLRLRLRAVGLFAIAMT